MTKRLARLRTEEHGMAVAEYALATVAACSFAGLLYLLISKKDEGWAGLIFGIFEKTIGQLF